MTKSESTQVRWTNPQLCNERDNNGNAPRLHGSIARFFRIPLVGSVGANKPHGQQAMELGGLLYVLNICNKLEQEDTFVHIGCGSNHVSAVVHLLFGCTCVGLECNPQHKDGWHKVGKEMVQSGWNGDKVGCHFGDGRSCSVAALLATKGTELPTGPSLVFCWNIGFCKEDNLALLAYFARNARKGGVLVVLCELDLATLKMPEQPVKLCMTTEIQSAHVGWDTSKHISACKWHFYKKPGAPSEAPSALQVAQPTPPTFSKRGDGNALAISINIGSPQLACRVCDWNGRSWCDLAKHCLQKGSKDKRHLEELMGIMKEHRENIEQDPDASKLLTQQFMKLSCLEGQWSALAGGIHLEDQQHLPITLPGQSVGRPLNQSVMPMLAVVEPMADAKVEHPLFDPEGGPAQPVAVGGTQQNSGPPMDGATTTGGQVNRGYDVAAAGNHMPTVPERAAAKQTRIAEQPAKPYITRPASKVVKLAGCMKGGPRL